MLRKLPTIGLSLRTPHFFLGERWPIFYLLPQPHLAEKSPFVQGEALYCCWDLGTGLSGSGAPGEEYSEKILLQSQATVILGA